MNYERRASWLFRPEGRKRDKRADVFFVYPTVYFHPNKNKRHNMNPRNPVYRLFAWFLTVWRARAFTDSCNLFAPHYRQVGIEGLEMSGEELRPYEKIARDDIRGAFYYYLERLNEGRPFILAGHSQGAERLLDLMAREFRESGLPDRFVAAYLIGYSVTKDDLAHNPHLRLAEGEDDLGGIITYNSSAEGLKLMRVVREGSVCVNPLNWKRTAEYAPKSMNLGSVLFDFGKYFRLEKRHFTGAYIDTERGVVMIDRDALTALLHIRVGFLNRILIRKGTLHMLDIALFHRNLQKNVAARVAGYFETRGGKVP